MREVRDRLRALDQIEAPDLRERIRSWEPRPPHTEPLLKRVAIALLALVVAAAGIAFAVRALHPSEPPTRPATTIENGLIVFARGGPDSGLFVMNGDGTDVRRLPSERGDTDPTWSPDGSSIAFVRFHDGNGDIFVMDADGSSVRQLTDGRSDGSPAWSPDGTRIAFVREAREPGAEVANADIYVVNADGTDLARATDDPLMEASPSWSPDGSRIAFVGYDEASGGRGPSAVPLYVMNQDGTDIRALGPENVAQPTWSPDGSEIAYVDTETGSIMTIGPDGAGQRRIIDVAELVGGVHLVYRPTWSPDGTKIAFMAGPGAGNTYIYVVRRDGSGVSQLTRGPASDAEPAWQPVVADESPASPFPEGSITVSPGMIPEGALLLQLGTTAEILPSDSDRSLRLGEFRVQELSPDGRQVLGVDGSRLITIDLSTGAQTRLAEVGADRYILTTEWSPDGGRVAYRLGLGDPTGSSEACVVDVATQQQNCLSGLSDVYTLHWAPDGLHLIVAGPGQGVQSVAVDTGEVTTLVPAEGSPTVTAALQQAGYGSPTQFVDPSWSPSGKYIGAFANMRGGSAAYVPVILDAEGRLVAMGKPSADFPGFNGFSWSPVSDLFAYGLADSPNHVNEVHALDPVSGEDRLLDSIGGSAGYTIRGGAVWSPSGRYIAVEVQNWSDQGYGLPSDVQIVPVGGEGSVRQFSFNSGSLAGWGPG